MRASVPNARTQPRSPTVAQRTADAARDTNGPPPLISASESDSDTDTSSDESDDTEWSTRATAASTLNAGQRDSEKPSYHASPHSDKPSGSAPSRHVSAPEGTPSAASASISGYHSGTDSDDNGPPGLVTVSDSDSDTESSSEDPDDPAWSARFRAPPVRTGRGRSSATGGRGRGRARGRGRLGQDARARASTPTHTQRTSITDSTPNARGATPATRSNRSQMHHDRSAMLAESARVRQEIRHATAATVAAASATDTIAQTRYNLRRRR